MKMFRTSRLQKIVKVPQVHVIDEVAKVPRSMRRQVPMIQEMQKGPDARGDADQFQSLLHKQDGQTADNDPRFTMNSRERPPRRRCQTHVLREQERARRLHQTCRPVDPCARAR